MPPPILDLDAAVFEILTAFRVPHPGRRPFFFIAGAGVSAPSVPLSAQIVDHCKAAVGTATASPPASTSSPLDVYSFWFDRAYPQALDRQAYLRGLVEGKPVTSACLRLAHLLGSRNIANLLITPNFDDLMTKALSTFALPYVVCDHPQTVDRIDLASDDIAVVHVHGSYKFYDCRNLRGEIEDRARPSSNTTRTMAAFLDRVLSFSSPIVVGYAGWEGDVIMASLKRRLTGSTLPYRLYWFCHDDTALAALQRDSDWLADHPDVRLVASPASPSTASVADSTATSTLSAQSVFEALVRAFGLDEPELTRDPIRFYARQLRGILTTDVAEPDAEGIYSLEGVVARIERAAELEAEEFGVARELVGKGGLEAVRHLLRKSLYSRALVVAGEVMAGMTDPEREDLFSLITTALESEDLRPADSFAANNLRLSLLSCIPSLSGTRRYYAIKTDALIGKGTALSQLGRPADALEALDEAMEFVTEQKPQMPGALGVYVATRRALALAALAKHEAAVAVYDTVIPTLRSEGPAWLLAQAEHNRAIYLTAAGKVEEGLASMSAFVSAHKAAEDGFTQVLVAGGLVDIASAHKQEGRDDLALRALEDLKTLYGTTRHHQVTPIVARGLSLMAQILQDLQRISDAFKVLEELRDFCGKAGLATMREKAKARGEQLRKRLVGTGAGLKAE